MSRSIALLLCAWLSWPVGSQAATGYNVENMRWDGLSRLQSTAAEAGVVLESTRELNWTHIHPTDYLILMHPHEIPDVPSVRLFLEDGGTVLLADDFGAGRGLAEAFGIHMTSPNARSRTLDAWPHPPVRPPGDAFLGFNMPPLGVVHLNHPAVVTGGEGLTTHLQLPGPDQFVLVEKKVGKGTFLVLTDPSLWINTMMTSHPNKQLAANLLRRHCQAARCVVQMILPGFTEVGAYQSQRGVAGAAWFITRLRTRTQRALGALQARMRTLQSGPGPLLLLLLILGFITLPLLHNGKKRSDSRDLSPAPVASLATPFHQGWDTADFTLPAKGALRRLLRALPPGARAHIDHPSEHRALARSLALNATGEDARDVENAALHAFQFLPILEEPVAPVLAQSPRVTGVEFQGLCRAIDRVLNASGDRA